MRESAAAGPSSPQTTTCLLRRSSQQPAPARRAHSHSPRSRSCPPATGRLPFAAAFSDNGRVLAPTALAPLTTAATDGGRPAAHELFCISSSPRDAPSAHPRSCTQRGRRELGRARVSIAPERRGCCVRKGACSLWKACALPSHRKSPRRPRRRARSRPNSPRFAWGLEPHFLGARTLAPLARQASVTLLWERPDVLVAIVRCPSRSQRLDADPRSPIEDVAPGFLTHIGISSTWVATPSGMLCRNAGGGDIRISNLIIIEIIQRMTSAWMSSQTRRRRAHRVTNLGQHHSIHRILGLTRHCTQLSCSVGVRQFEVLTYRHADKPPTVPQQT